MRTLIRITVCMSVYNSDLGALTYRIYKILIIDEHY